MLIKNCTWAHFNPYNAKIFLYKSRDQKVIMSHLRLFAIAKQYNYA